MLKQRVITAVILAPLGIAAVFLLPTFYFKWLLIGVVAIAGFEWAAFLGFKQVYARLAYSSALVTILSLVWWQLPLDIDRQTIWLSFLWWTIALVWLKFSNVSQSIYILPAKALAGCFVILPACIALVLMQNLHHGAYYILFLLLIIWGADIGAYFSGKRWGRRKLAPSISPGKTWEGVFGGVAAALLIAGVGACFFAFDQGTLLLFAGIVVFIALISVLGDLFESLMKRQAGLKDSGQLLPGHGGILDRFDSLFAAAPFFVMGLEWMGLAYA